MRIVLDTNVFVAGFVALAGDEESVDAAVLRRLLLKREVLLLSAPLEEQLMRVVLRVKDKDFAGLVRYLLWSDFRAEFVPLENEEIRKRFEQGVPRKDLDIFLTALLGKADVLVSNDADFLNKASEARQSFRCVRPDGFLKEVQGKTG